MPENYERYKKLVEAAKRLDQAWEEEEQRPTAYSGDEIEYSENLVRKAAEELLS